ncbi:acyl-CoA N-acyltransferase [Macroventuria anomochaeta]|uniref:Acyl-CoA N-acyltransferase n=1 Tax=Macroventuria anomochaeta TaxID=301207 RepID=A0ACB6RQB2_9PLEO|nr:acyl-CoA N-acyltransferase [Macroventuria anomochaeta]KAF2623318.1 acyl-CoA N-acyltransferase [Macroventuria anomochaeta]
MAASIRPIVKIRPAIFPADKEAVKELFLAYEQFLLDFADVKLDFQNFDHEVASLPGKYAVENDGALYLAYIEMPTSHDRPAIEKTVGCMGLRAFTASQSGELKRLYLTPESRGLGVSKLLMDVAIARARELGYKEILLDTLSSMATARKLYEKYGFVEVPAYYESHPDAVFYQLEL